MKSDHPGIDIIFTISNHKNSLKSVKSTVRNERAIPLVFRARSIDEGCLHNEGQIRTCGRPN